MDIQAEKVAGDITHVMDASSYADARTTLDYKVTAKAAPYARSVTNFTCQMQRASNATKSRMMFLAEELEKPEETGLLPDPVLDVKQTKRNSVVRASQSKAASLRV